MKVQEISNFKLKFNTVNLRKKSRSPEWFQHLKLSYHARNDLYYLVDGIFLHYFFGLQRRKLKKMSASTQEKATLKEHVMFMRERKRGQKQFDKVQKNVDIELPDLNGFPPRRLKQCR